MRSVMTPTGNPTATHAPSLLLATAAAVAALLAGCSADHGGAGQSAGSAKQPFTVTSTLDGKRALPHRIGWIASTSLPASKVARVEFLVDGRVAWVERKPPYSFSEDGGYLVTSWIEPGRRSFTVRAIATDGRTAIDSVRARVDKAPAPPASLAGRWSRTIETSNAPPAGSKGNPTDTHTPSGTYTIVFDGRFLQTRFPGSFVKPGSDSTGEGWILDADYTVAPRALRVGGAVTVGRFDGTQREGGWWCLPGGPPAIYRWSVSGGTLTLKPRGGKDACGIRGFIWKGTWHRR